MKSLHAAVENVYANSFLKKESKKEEFWQFMYSRCQEWARVSKSGGDYKRKRWFVVGPFIVRF